MSERKKFLEQVVRERRRLLRPLVQEPVRHASVAIFDEAGQAAEVLTEDGLRQLNPLVADSEGHVSGYLEPGSYEIEVKAPGHYGQRLPLSITAD